MSTGTGGGPGTSTCKKDVVKAACAIQRYGTSAAATNRAGQGCAIPRKRDGDHDKSTRLKQARDGRS
jgi:hypothetical protein